MAGHRSAPISSTSSMGTRSSLALRLQRSCCLGCAQPHTHQTLQPSLCPEPLPRTTLRRFNSRPRRAWQRYHPDGHHRLGAREHGVWPVIQPEGATAEAALRICLALGCVIERVAVSEGIGRQGRRHEERAGLRRRQQGPRPWLEGVLERVSWRRCLLASGEATAVRYAR